MRHRIGGLENVYMGLGADNIECELNNTWSENQLLNKVADEMLNDAVDKLFSEIGGFDFDVRCNDNSFVITFGFEPAYMYDPYQMCKITSEYKDSSITKGIAKGYYGKDVEITYSKTVIDKDCDENFVDFVDKWYDKLLETMEGNNNGRKENI
jgi:hypothetical protein